MLTRTKIDVYRALRLWLALLSIHSLVLGVLIYLFPALLLRPFAFELSGDLFFPRQSGVFLVILGVGYGLAAIDPQGRKELVFLAVFSKCVAVAFLLAESLLFRAPLGALAAGAMDGSLGGILLVLALTFYRQSRVEAAQQPAET